MNFNITFRLFHDAVVRARLRRIDNGLHLILKGLEHMSEIVEQVATEAAKVDTKTDRIVTLVGGVATELKELKDAFDAAMGSGDGDALRAVRDRLGATADRLGVAADALAASATAADITPDTPVEPKPPEATAANDVAASLAAGAMGGTEAKVPDDEAPPNGQ